MPEQETPRFSLKPYVYFLAIFLAVTAVISPAVIGGMIPAEAITFVGLAGLGVTIALSNFLFLGLYLLLLTVTAYSVQPGAPENLFLAVLTGVILAVNALYVILTLKAPTPTKDFEAVEKPFRAKKAGQPVSTVVAPIRKPVTKPTAAEKPVEAPAAAPEEPAATAEAPATAPEEPAGGIPAPTGEGSDDPNTVTILWGSETGNAEGLADMTASRLEENGISAQVIDMAKITAGDLPRFKRVLILTSTWGDGDPPSNAVDLVEGLQKAKDLDLKGMAFSVLALGDTSYPQFCKCGKDFDQMLEAYGGHRFFNRVDCDLDYDEPFENWLTGVLPHLKKQAVAV